MRTRAGWPAGRTRLGSSSGAGIGMPSRIRSLLALLAVGIQACVACLLLAGSLATGARPAGQHRCRRPRHAAPRTRGAVLAVALRLTARVLP